MKINLKISIRDNITLFSKAFFMTPPPPPHLGNKPKKRGAFALLLISTIVLTACGGGGGGGATPVAGGGGAAPVAGGGDAQFSEMVLNAVNEKTNAAEIATIAGDNLRSHTPRFGSVTQSSRGDGGTTTDKVDAMVELVSRSSDPSDSSSPIESNLDITLTNSGADATWGEINITDIPITTEEGYFEVRLDTQKVPTSDDDDTAKGDLYYHVYTNAGAGSDGTLNTDYEVGGVWLYVPKDENLDGFEIGAFADLSDSEKLTENTVFPLATASYEGDTAAYAMFSPNSEGGSVLIEELSAMVSFTADFADNMIEGYMKSTIDNDPNDLYVLFNKTTIKEAGNARTFAGNINTLKTLSRETAVTKQALDDATALGFDFAGKWGGEFGGGAVADKVVGTFAVSSDKTFMDDENNMGRLTIIGAFGADKQSTTSQ